MFTQIQKTGISSQGGRPPSATSSVTVSITSPMSSGLGVQTADPTPTTRPQITMRPTSALAGRVSRQTMAASTAVVSPMRTRRPWAPNQLSIQP